MYFWTYRLRKTWLDKYLKSRFSEDPSTSNMVNGRRHRSKLSDSTYNIFTDLREDNSGWRSLSEWYAKSYDCLLTHLLPMISIPFLKKAILCNIFRCIYLKKEKYFPIFFAFSKFRLNFEHFQKKDDRNSWCISELTDSEKRG